MDSLHSPMTRIAWSGTVSVWWANCVRMKLQPLRHFGDTEPVAVTAVVVVAVTMTTVVVVAVGMTVVVVVAVVMTPVVVVAVAMAMAAGQWRAEDLWRARWSGNRSPDSSTSPWVPPEATVSHQCLRPGNRNRNWTLCHRCQETQRGRREFGFPGQISGAVRQVGESVGETPLRAGRQNVLGPVHKLPGNWLCSLWRRQEDLGRCSCAAGSPPRCCVVFEHYVEDVCCLGRRRRAPTLNLQRARQWTHRPLRHYRRRLQVDHSVSTTRKPRCRGLLETRWNVDPLLP